MCGVIDDDDDDDDDDGDVCCDDNSFYKGLRTKLLHSVLTSALLFLVKEQAHILTFKLLFVFVALYMHLRKPLKSVNSSQKTMVNNQ
jgi:hypothetical protein